MRKLKRLPHETRPWPRDKTAGRPALRGEKRTLDELAVEAMDRVMAAVRRLGRFPGEPVHVLSAIARQQELDAILDAIQRTARDAYRAERVAALLAARARVIKHQRVGEAHPGTNHRSRGRPEAIPHTPLAPTGTDHVTP